MLSTDANSDQSEHPQEEDSQPCLLADSLSASASILLEQFDAYCKITEQSSSRDLPELVGDRANKLREFLLTLTTRKTDSVVIKALRRVISNLIVLNATGKSLLGQRSFLGELLEALNQSPFLIENAKQLLALNDYSNRTNYTRLSLMLRCHIVEELPTVAALLGPDAVVNQLYDKRRSGLYYAARFSPENLLWVLDHLPGKMINEMIWFQNRNPDETMLECLKRYQQEKYPAQKIAEELYEQLYLLLQILSGETFFSIDKLQALLQNPPYLLLFLKCLTQAQWGVILEEDQQSPNPMIGKALSYYAASGQPGYRTIARKIYDEEVTNWQKEAKDVHTHLLALSLRGSANRLLGELMSYVTCAEQRHPSSLIRLDMPDAQNLRFFFRTLSKGETDRGVLEALGGKGKGKDVVKPIHLLFILNGRDQPLLGQRSFLGELLEALNKSPFLIANAKRLLALRDPSKRTTLSLMLRCHTVEELPTVAALLGPDAVVEQLFHVDIHGWSGLHYAACSSPETLLWVLTCLPAEKIRTMIQGKTKKGETPLGLLEEYRKASYPAPKIGDELYDQLHLLLSIIRGEINVEIDKLQELLQQEPQYLSLLLKVLTKSQWSIILAKEQTFGEKRPILNALQNIKTEHQQQAQDICQEAATVKAPSDCTIANALKPCALGLHEQLDNYCSYFETDAENQQHPIQKDEPEFHFAIRELLHLIISGAENQAIIQQLGKMIDGVSIFQWLIRFDLAANQPLQQEASFSSQLLTQLSQPALRNYDADKNILPLLKTYWERPSVEQQTTSLELEYKGICVVVELLSGDVNESTLVNFVSFLRSKANDNSLDCAEWRVLHKYILNKQVGDNYILCNTVLTALEKYLVETRECGKSIGTGVTQLLTLLATILKDNNIDLHEKLKEIVQAKTERHQGFSGLLRAGYSMVLDTEIEHTQARSEALLFEKLLQIVQSSSTVDTSAVKSLLWQYNNRSSQGKREPEKEQIGMEMQNMITPEPEPLSCPITSP